MRKSERKKRTYLIIGLCAILVIMAVGFAAFSQQLQINGTSNITSSWNVQITSIERFASSGAGVSDVSGSPSYDNTNGLTATFNTNLTSPGDYAIYKIKVENLGSLNAKLSNITLNSDSSNDITYYVNKNHNNEDITDTDRLIKENDVLNPQGDSSNLDEGYVYVTVKYNNYEGQTSPTGDNKTVSATVKLDFVQSSSGAVPAVQYATVGGQQVEIVDTGDGLYEDDYPDDDVAYIYRGANLNNYINLGSDLYRIMSIDTSGNIKVIKDTPFNLVWDPGFSTSISGITDASSTAGTRYIKNSSYYCFAMKASSYYGCKSWGSNTSTLNSAGTSTVTQMPWEAGSSTLKYLPTYDSYLNVYLNGGTYPTSSGTTTLTSWYSSNVASNLQSKIVSHLWNVGPVASDSSLTLAQNIGQEAAYKWSGKVGLMTATDYVRASTNSACTNVYNYNSNSSCYNNSSIHNWLYKNSSQWTMAPYSYSNPYHAWYADGSGNLNNSSAYNSYGVRPVLYLSSSTSITGSSGTSSSPFTAS